MLDEGLELAKEASETAGCWCHLVVRAPGACRRAVKGTVSETAAEADNLEGKVCSVRMRMKLLGSHSLERSIYGKQNRVHSDSSLSPLVREASYVSRASSATV